MASRRSVERRWSWLASEQGCSSLGGRGKRRELLEVCECKALVVRHEGLAEVKLDELLETCERLERLVKIGTKI